MDETTQPSRSLSEESAGSIAGAAHALVLVWSRDEPARAGEVLLVPGDEPGAPWAFGRESASSARSHRLGLARQRPGRNEPAPPLSCPRISRTQLHLSAEPGGPLVVSNVGRCPLVHRGREVSRVELAPGDVIELRHELVLLCARRPRVLPALAPESTAPVHPFGEADAFGLVGEGPAIWELRRAITALARRSIHVLVLGPSGSGKELVAHAIHAQSQRADRPLVARNAATIPEGLVDAELFGHARSFPNPGTPERPGLVGEAASGTLFLDEFAELPPALQAHLLRVLDGGEYHRLGEARARRADVRFIAATNRHEQAIKHDVLARFKARLSVPDLDARRDDIPLLAAHLLRRQAQSEPALLARFFPQGDPRGAPRTTPELMAALVQHRYRTHVRELDALLLAATIESQGRYVDLTPGVARLLSEAARAPSPPPAVAGGLAAAAESFTPEEQRRLALQRKHAFQAADCARDPEYGASRQTADLHLRQILSRALLMSGWDVDVAAGLLAGDDSEQRGRLRRRLSTFLFNLRHRLEEEGGEALRRSLANEWRAGAPVALRLVDALESGKVRDGRPED